MSKLANKIVKNQLRKLGVDVDNPEKATFNALDNLIKSSVPSLVSEERMIKFLNGWVDKLEQRKMQRV